MKFRSIAVAVLGAAAAVSALAGDAPKAGHPHFDDGGTLAWTTKLADAKAAAKSADKLIFIEYGRKACGNCKAVCQNTLPDPAVKERLSKLCVGLAAECDPPGEEADVQAFFRDNLSKANVLPFCGFVTHDGKWIAGFSGHRDAAAFVKVLEEVEKSPLLDASPEGAKKLDALATQAAAAVEKENWKAVLTASKDAQKISGRAPSRERIAASVAAARAFAEKELASALEKGRAASDRPGARAALKKLSSTFGDEPEGREAEAGVKALDRLGVLEGVPADKVAAAREKAAGEFKGTRWAALFTDAAPAK